MPQGVCQQLENKEEEISVTDIQVTTETEKRILESLFSKVVAHIVTGFLYRLTERW